MIWVRRGVESSSRSNLQPWQSFFFSCTVTISARNSTLKEGRKVEHVRIRPMILEGSESWLSGVTQSWGCCWPAGSPASHLSAYMGAASHGIGSVRDFSLWVPEDLHIWNQTWSSMLLWSKRLKVNKRKKKTALISSIILNYPLEREPSSIYLRGGGSTSSILQATGPMWQG